MKMQIIRKRQAQRKRLARSIKHLRIAPESQNKKDGLESLKRIARNYPKIKGSGIKDKPNKLFIRNYFLLGGN